MVALLAAVVWVVGQPLMSAGRSQPDDRNAELDELEIRKQSKYREIRDAELEFRAGKLSESDYREIDRELRAEAIRILQRIDELSAGGPGD